MKQITAILAILMFASSPRLGRANPARYDFQNTFEEGAVELYRVDVDTAKKKGTLCFATSGASGLPDELRDKISAGELWSKIVDLSGLPHACFDFDVYGPFFWFYSPAVKYGIHEFRFFFAGTLSESTLSGKLHLLVDVDKEKFTEEIEVKAQRRPNSR